MPNQKEENQTSEVRVSLETSSTGCSTPGMVNVEKCNAEEEEVSNSESNSKDQGLINEENKPTKDLKMNLNKVTTEIEKIQKTIEDAKKELKGKKKEAREIQAMNLETERERGYDFGLLQKIFTLCKCGTNTIYIFIIFNIVFSTLNSTSDVSVVSLLYRQGFQGHAYRILGNEADVYRLIQLFRRS